MHSVRLKHCFLAILCCNQYYKHCHTIKLSSQNSGISDTCLVKRLGCRKLLDCLDLCCEALKSSHFFHFPYEPLFLICFNFSRQIPEFFFYQWRSKHVIHQQQIYSLQFLRLSQFALTVFNLHSLIIQIHFLIRWILTAKNTKVLLVLVNILDEL